MPRKLPPPSDVKTLPGMKPTPGMRTYLLFLEDAEPPSAARGRSAVVDRNLALTGNFRHYLTDWLRQQGLEGQVSAIGEPMAVPSLAITCTSDLSEALARLPHVEAVVPGDAEMQFVR